MKKRLAFLPLSVSRRSSLLINKLGFPGALLMTRVLIFDWYFVWDEWSRLNKSTLMDAISFVHEQTGYTSDSELMASQKSWAERLFCPASKINVSLNYDKEARVKEEADKRIMNSPMRFGHFWRAFRERCRRGRFSLRAGPPLRARLQSAASRSRHSTLSLQRPVLPVPPHSQAVNTQPAVRRSRQSPPQPPATKRGAGLPYRHSDRITWHCRCHGAPRTFSGTLRRVH